LDIWASCINSNKQQKGPARTKQTYNLTSYKPIKRKTNTKILKTQEKTEKKDINKEPTNNYNDHHNQKKWGMKRCNQTASFAQNLPNLTRKSKV